MKLLLNSINAGYMEDLLLEAANDTERVDAAVAYASDEKLFEWCWSRSIPLHFRGRFDDQVPIHPDILKRFLARGSPNFTCRLVRHLHAKIIWWRGFGAYIGSANLSNRAWGTNAEAGVFMTETELAGAGYDVELDGFFATIDKHGSWLSDEIYRHIASRAQQVNNHNTRDRPAANAFEATALVGQWGGLGHVSKRAAADMRRSEFLREWNATLQTMRDIARLVSTDGNRPQWIQAGTPAGAQADQFLHAHYNQRTFDGRRANYEAHFTANRANPAKALQEAITWWRTLPRPPGDESVMLDDWAPFLRSSLAEDALAQVAEQQWIEIFLRVHAIRDHARRMSNAPLGLVSNRQHSIDEKTTSLARRVFHSMSAQGTSAVKSLAFVLYGGPQAGAPERLWDAVTKPQWRIEHFGISAIGELIGWAQPDLFPPRNGRTSKALRSLGYDVRVHTE